MTEEASYAMRNTVLTIVRVLKQDYARQQKRYSPSSGTKQRAEAVMLSKIFHKAKQIIFIPLWDASGGK